MPTPKPTPKSKAKKVQDILKKNQKLISKEGIAAYDAEARKAIENKYPGMYIPETRITPGINRSR